ncbi:hypothetical protein MHK_008146 [Candidatus Magnetomorum sp. HK-1]|nr:hypothetical protein MHK_008146 [Candidatus Magnetomorum sp. HK-1]
MTQYEKIIQDNLKEVFQIPPQTLEKNLIATYLDGNFSFKAFGQICRMTSDAIFLDNNRQTGPMGIVLSLYAKYSVADELIAEPFKAFKSFPNTAPYVGAFSTHTEHILIPKVEIIEANKSLIYEKLEGKDAPENLGGDFAFCLKPLPKIMLCYIFYMADEDFPASVTCLFSNNATRFLPNDGLADTGEYTSKYILSIL